MKNEQLSTRAVQHLAWTAAETIIKDGFMSWHRQYYGYPVYLDYDAFEEAHNCLDRVEGYLGKEEISEIFDEAEEFYRAKIDPQVWELYKNKAQRPESDRPVASIEEDDFWANF